MLYYVAYGYYAYNMYKLTQKLETAWSVVSSVRHAYSWVFPPNKPNLDGDLFMLDDWTLVEATVK